MAECPIFAWLVWAPSTSEFDYLIFAEEHEAYDKQAEFDEDDPENEHAVEALVRRRPDTGDGGSGKSGL